MANLRLIYAPLALLITISTPSKSQAQEPAGQGHQSPDQAAKGQAPQGQKQPRQHQGNHGRSPQTQATGVAPVAPPPAVQTPRGQGTQEQERRGQRQGPQGQVPHVQTVPVTQPPVQLPQQQVPQRQGQQGQGQGGRRPAPQIQNSPVLRPPAPTTQGQGQSQQRQGQRFQDQLAGQRSRRNNPGIQIYHGPSDYRAGSRPPSIVQRQYSNRNLDQYRREYRAERRFHVRPYLQPRGWYSYDWALGDILPQLFWNQSYWLSNYWLYGLPVPPYGCIWVRYNTDALLINRDNGEVIEVIYDVFY